MVIINKIFSSQLSTGKFDECRSPVGCLQGHWNLETAFY